MRATTLSALGSIRTSVDPEPTATQIARSERASESGPTSPVETGRARNDAHGDARRSELVCTRGGANHSG
jgi:hypothetical protein